MGKDLEEPALSYGVDVRHSRYHGRQQDAVPYDPKPSRSFRDQHVAVWQERYRPWDLESFHHGHHAVSVLG